MAQAKHEPGSRHEPCFAARESLLAKLAHEVSHILDTGVAGIRHRKAHKKLLAHPDLEQCLQAVA